MKKILVIIKIIFLSFQLSAQTPEKPLDIEKGSLIISMGGGEERTFIGLTFSDFGEKYELKNIADYKGRPVDLSQSKSLRIVVPFTQINKKTIYQQSVSRRETFQVDTISNPSNINQLERLFWFRPPFRNLKYKGLKCSAVEVFVHDKKLYYYGIVYLYKNLPVLLYTKRLTNYEIVPIYLHSCKIINTRKINKKYKEKTFYRKINKHLIFNINWL